MITNGIESEMEKIRIYGRLKTHIKNCIRPIRCSNRIIFKGSSWMTSKIAQQPDISEPKQTAFVHLQKF
jgi:hypothetical protein